MPTRTDALVRDGVIESFWTEFLTYWHRLPNKALFFGAFAGWALLFQFLGNGTFGYLDTGSLFHWMIWAYNGSAVTTDDGHGNLVPFVVLWLLWWKRKEIIETPVKSWTPGLVIVTFALLVHVVGYAVQQPRISIVALFVGIYGLMGLAWGPQFLRVTFFPFILFTFSMPLGTMTEKLTFNLRLIMTELVEFTGRGILGLNVVRVGTGLFDGAGQYQYDVAPACSGIRSLWAMFVIAVAYGYVMFRASWKWLVLIVAAFPLAVIGNSLRLLCIVAAAQWFGRDSGDSVHNSPIWSLLPYVPVILGLSWLSHGLHRFERAVQEHKKKGAAK